MNQEEMLKELGLSREEFNDLLAKFRTFMASLDERQHATVRRSLPDMAEALASFGGDATPDDLRKLFEEESGRPPILGGGGYFMCRRSAKK